jgi:hypothetical protein
MKTITQKESFLRLKSTPSLASTKFAERIINDCENARELKCELEWQFNKYKCLEEQSSKKELWNAGNKYSFLPQKIAHRLLDLTKIADAMNYEVYSPNGAYFIKPKKSNK